MGRRVAQCLDPVVTARHDGPGRVYEDRTDGNFPRSRRPFGLGKGQLHVGLHLRIPLFSPKRPGIIDLPGRLVKLGA